MQNKQGRKPLSLKARIVAITTGLLIAASWMFAWQLLMGWSGQVIAQATQNAVNAQELLIESVHAYTQGKARWREQGGYDANDNNTFYAEFTQEQWSSITLNDIVNTAGQFDVQNGTYKISDANGGLIYSTMSEQTEAGIGLSPPETGETLAVLRKQNGQNLVFVSSYVRFLPSELSRVDLALDITHMVAEMERTVLRAILLLLLLSLFLLAVLYRIISKTLEPLYDLGRQAQAMASGEYSLRANVWKDDEIGALAVEFNHMADAVQTHTANLLETAKRRELFAANLSHEIKTPLTSIVGYADLATSLALDPDILSDPRKTGRLIDMLDFIKREGRRLDSLSKTLLEWSALHAGQEIDRHVCRADRLLRHVMHILKPSLDAKGQTLEVGHTVSRIYADETLIVSLLANLCGNAAKASQTGGRIRLVLDSLPDGTLCITVADKGEGIAPEEIAHVTEPFYMADKARDRRKGGSGMGLAICKSIVQAHGGTMEIKSEKGWGTVIQIAIPGGVPAGGPAKLEADDDA